MRATTRLPARAQVLDGVEWATCDIRREHDLRQALEGISTIYHCAAMSGAPGSLDDYNDANVAGTLRLARLAAEAGVETIVYVSTLSVYGLPHDPRRPVDESTPYDERAAERGVYTQSKLEAEQALLEWARDHPEPRVVVLRPGTIYGPGGTLPVGRLQLLGLRRHRLIAGGGSVPMPLTYVDNLIDAMRAAASSTVPSGSVFNVVDEATTDQASVTSALRAASADRIRPVTVPYAAAWSLMLGVDLLGLARRRKLGTARFRLKRTLAEMRYECLAARQELGWEPSVSLEEGISRTLRS